MNWKSACLMGVLIMLCTLSCTGSLAAAHPAALDKAVLVNGALITGTEFHAELKRIERLQGKGNGSPDQIAVARLKKEALENLIVRELLYQEAEKEGIRVPESEAAAEMDGLRKRFANTSEYEITLGRMGLSEAAVRAQVGKGMAVRKFIEGKFGSKVKVTDADIEFYYEDHRDEFRVAGGQAGSFRPLFQVRDKIRGQIKQERIDRELNPYLKRLRDAAKVEILLDGDAE